MSNAEKIGGEYRSSNFGERDLPGGVFADNGIADKKARDRNLW